MPTRARLWWTSMLAAAIATTTCLILASSAAASTPNFWPYVPNCPADDPAMVANPPGAYTACVLFSAGADLKVGTGELHAPGFHPEFGAFGPDPDHVSIVPQSVPKSWPATIDTALNNNDLWQICAQLPGGPGPTPNPLPVTPYSLCFLLVDELNQVGVPSASIDLVGPPSDFEWRNVPSGGHVLTLPVKIGVHDPAGLLGASCSIGSASQPIVLHLTYPGLPGEPQPYQSPDPNGYPVTFTNYSGGPELSDNSFAAPAATGCGPADLFDGIVNGMFGLPSPSGANSASLIRNVWSAETTAGGSVLSQAYHAGLGG